MLLGWHRESAVLSRLCRVQLPLPLSLSI